MPKNACGAEPHTLRHAGYACFGEAVRVDSPLVRYEYNGSGDLLRIIGRDGKVKRSFGYDRTGNLIHLELADVEGQNYSYEPLAQVRD